MALVKDPDFSLLLARIEESNRKRLYARAAQQQTYLAMEFPIEDDVEIKVLGIVDVKQGKKNGDDR